MCWDTEEAPRSSCLCGVIRTDGGDSAQEAMCWDTEAQGSSCLHQGRDRWIETLEWECERRGACLEV